MKLVCMADTHGKHEKSGLPDVAIGLLVGSQHFTYLTNCARDHVTIEGVTFSLVEVANAVEPDVVISHAPPTGILGGMGIRSNTIREALERVDFDVHVFGHIHESYGQIEQGSTSFINASIESNSGTLNDPITIKIGKR